MATTLHDLNELARTGGEPDSIPGALNSLVLVAAIGVATFLLWLASHVESWWWMLAAALGFSFVNNTIFSLLHEAVHGKFHAARAVNEWCGRIAAGFFPTSFSMQRAFHLGHHRRNRTEVERFDYIGPGESKFLKTVQWYSILTGLYWLSAPAGCAAFLVAPGLLRRPAFRSKSSALARQTSTNAMIADLNGVCGWKARLDILLSIVIQAMLFVLLDLNWFGWACCYAAFAVNWSSLQYADHAWSELDVRHGAWNLRVNRVVQFLFLNYHHHLAHHRHPEVPWIHLHRYVDFSVHRPRFLSIYLQMWRGPRTLPVAHSTAVPDTSEFRSLQTIAENGSSSELGNTRNCEVTHAIAWRESLGICTLFAVFFCVGYGLTDWVTSLHNFRVPVHFSFELHWPFVPAFSIVYSSLYLLMGIAPFVFRSGQELWPLVLTMMVATLVAAVFFLLLPAAPAFVHESPSGMSGVIFRLADAINLDHNYFPSLHVTYAWTTAVAIGRRLGAVPRWAVLFWAAAISHSTLLTHQHYLLDVAGGIALAVIAMTIVYPRIAAHYGLKPRAQAKFGQQFLRSRVRLP